MWKVHPKDQHWMDRNVNKKAPFKCSLKTPSPCRTFCKLRRTWGWLSEPQAFVTRKIGKLPWSWNHGTLQCIAKYVWIRSHVVHLSRHFRLALHQLFYSAIVTAKRTTKGCSCLPSWSWKLSGTANATGLALALDLLASRQATQFPNLGKIFGS